MMDISFPPEHSLSNEKFPACLGHIRDSTKYPVKWGLYVTVTRIPIQQLVQCKVRERFRGSPEKKTWYLQTSVCLGT